MTHVFLLCCVIALTVAAYYPGLYGGYIFDDFPNFVANPQVHIAHLTWNSLVRASFSSDSGMLHRPISMLTLALNYYFFGLKPFAYKVTNLIIHILNGIGLYVLTRQILHVYRKIHRPALPENLDYWVALAVSAAWLLHPLNLTAVLYVAQRMASLATLFSVIGLSFYTWGRWRLWNGQTGLSLILIGLIGFGSLSILSKESGALLPLYMLVIEYSIFRFETKGGQPDRAVRWFFILFLAVPAAACLAWFLADPHRFLGAYAIRTFTLDQRLLTEPRVILFYLRLIFLPSLGQLGLFHDDFPLSYSLFNPPSTILAIAILALLFLAALRFRKKVPLISLGILWFFTGQALESTALPLEIAFEHRNYLADYGILLPVGFYLLQAAHAKKTVAIRRVALVIFVGMLFTLTLFRAQIWGNDVDLAVFEAQYHPNSPRTVYEAGRILVNLTLAGQKRYTAPAYEYLARAAKLDRSGIMPEVGLIIFAAKHGDPTKPQWITSIQQKLAKYPVSAATVSSLSELQKCQETRCKVSDDQMKSIFRSILQNPTLQALPQQHSDVLTIYGAFLINKLNNFAAGKAAFEQAVAASPRNFQYRINWIRLLIAMYRYHDARTQLAEVDADNPFHHYGDIFAEIRHELAALPDENGVPATKYRALDTLRKGQSPRGHKTPKNDLGTQPLTQNVQN